MLTLRVESEAAPVPEPGGPLRPDQDIWRDLDGVVCAWSETRDRERWMYVPRVGSYAFATGRDEIRAVPAPSAQSAAIHSAFIRTVLPMAVQFLGREVLHASAVLTDRGVVAFCAVSTTGKSTLAAALSRRGYPLWADDAVALEPADAAVDALALPFEAHLVPVDGLPLRHPPLERAPLAAVCVLARRSGAVAGPSLTVERLSATDGFMALLTHAYCCSPGDTERTRDMVTRYLQVASCVPLFGVTFEPGLARLPETLASIERAVGMAPPAAS